MGISIGEITRGMTILKDGELYEVLEFEHVKRARGSAFVRARLRGLRTGRVITETLRDSDDIEAAFMETRELQYLYRSGNVFVFMDKESFEQYELPGEVVSDIAGYLLEGMDLMGLFYQGEMVKVRPPNFVDLKVVEAPPGVKGDTATGGEKPVVLETGLTVKAPLFVKPGDVIRVDTRTGAYVERVG
ncbi:MAG: Elongation factor P [Acetothermia bacterium 64_32]|nr:MAG: Elongation factor P [Acetothermia bacterium 64_32]MBC7098183.1 elongation factor P [Candidatus Bipolaricaulota bacterium]HAF70149.1 elongation factor P [Candidatus Acetothermia bacterium]